MGQEPSLESLTLLDVAACGLLRTDDDGGFLRVNRVFASWVGYPVEALVAKRLFIVREIARAHRGDARVSSSAEGGTMFTIEFLRER